MVGLKQGSTLKSGKYKIVKTLGQGSFGITYLATTRISMDGQLGKMDVNVNVAIKEFFMSNLNSRATDGTSVERTSSTLVKNYLSKFQREAENLSKLHHPNIVKVLEVFDENNTTYYVMEFIDGDTIDEYIKRNGKLSVEESLVITKEVCKALSYMHDHKMLHLDLKPKNIMRGSEGHIYLIDFGLAKQYNDNGEPESSTTLGLGTPGYAPIEQANYKKDGTIPVTLDIYALGASLYKMLTGKTPPESSVILNEGFPLSSLQKAEISSNTISIVEKAMASVRKDRYQSVDSMLNAIESITSDEELTSYQDNEERTVYEEEVEVKSEDAYGDSPVDKIDIAENNKQLLTCKIRKIRIGMIVGLGSLLWLLSTISNIPLEIRNIVGYRTGVNAIEKKAIDLGLPSGTLWANCNIGAKSEQDDGEKYAFGTVESKEDYPENTGDEYKEGESIIGSSCDIASVKWGKDWQLPSKDQFNELIEKCKFYIKPRGYKVVGPNGNHIFLPYTRGNSSIGYYWSGNKGYVLEFQPGCKGVDKIDEATIAFPFATYCSLSIRPVKK